MNITVRNLTQAQLSTDLGLILPGQSVSMDLSPEEAYRASEGLKDFVAAGRCTVTVAAEPDLASDIGTPTATTSAMTLYVETSGSDTAGIGTQARPFRTIQAAVDKVPKTIRHPVTVNVGVGDFAGCTLAEFSFAPSSWLAIKGSLGSATVAGLASGTATGGTAGLYNTWGTLVSTGAGWTVDALRGLLVEVTVGAITDHRIVSRNTADTITVVGVWTAPTASSTFRILDWQTRINAGSSTYNVYGKSPISATVPAISLFMPHGSALTHLTSTTSPPYSSGPVVLDGLGFDYVGTSIGTINGHEQHSYVTRCRFELAASAIGVSMSARGATPFTVDRSFFRYNGNNAIGVLGGNINANSNLFYGNASGTGTGIGPNQSGNSGRMSVQYGDFRRLGTAVGGGLHIPLSIAHSNIDACTTGFDLLSAYNSVVNSSVSNTTTVFKLYRGPKTILEIDAITGTGNTTVLSLSDGSNAFIKSNVTITGATEISIDGVVSSFATMRAATPKYIINATTGTRVWGD